MLLQEGASGRLRTRDGLTHHLGDIDSTQDSLQLFRQEAGAPSALIAVDRAVTVQNAAQVPQYVTYSVSGPGTVRSSHPIRSTKGWETASTSRRKGAISPLVACSKACSTR